MVNGQIHGIFSEFDVSQIDDEYYETSIDGRDIYLIDDVYIEESGDFHYRWSLSDPIDFGEVEFGFEMNLRKINSQVSEKVQVENFEQVLIRNSTEVAVTLPDGFDSFSEGDTYQLQHCICECELDGQTRHLKYNFEAEDTVVTGLIQTQDDGSEIVKLTSIRMYDFDLSNLRERYYVISELIADEFDFCRVSI